MSVRTVGVVGSGIMGSGLAEVIAKGGMNVIVRSRQQASADAMVANVAKGLDKQVEKGRLSSEDRDAVMSRISAVSDLSGLADCDLVIESVVEDLETKKALFRELDAIVKPSAIIATNTSTLPVIELAMSTNRPDKVCGIHFFNPAPAMPLVEIVRPLSADDATITAATEFATACGKGPVQVLDRAGFIVNALLFPYLNNAIRMWEQGTASMEDIDAAMKGGCNFPMGPLELLDLVGLDTSLSIIEALHAAFGDANYEPAPMLAELVKDGKLGRKSGAGFYDYAKK